jgi:hypothetical protein
MNTRMTPESQLCACTKYVLFSSLALLDQRFLQFTSKVLINWSNKAELENRTLFMYVQNCDSGVMLTCMTLISYGKFSLIYKIFGLTITRILIERIIKVPWKHLYCHNHVVNRDGILQFKLKTKIGCP